MKAPLGPAKDTPTETMRFMQDLPTQTQTEMEQVKAYFSAVEHPLNRLHDAVKDTYGCVEELETLPAGTIKS